MIRKQWQFVVLFAAALGASAAFAAEPAPAGKPVIGKLCIACHQAEPNTLWGNFDLVASRANSIQMKIDDAPVLVKFDEDELKVLTTDGKMRDGEVLKQTKKGHEIKIEYIEKDGVRTAVRLVEKPPANLPPEMLISTAEIEKLVALGPEKGGYFLYDSRPLPRIQQGMIPTALSLPFPAFDKLAAKALPQDKNALIIFYCAGPSCSMSPGSAVKARALGYTNLKVYVDGMPAWQQKNHGVVSAQFLKEAWIDKGVSHVLLDVRSDAQAANGFIKGAVAFPAAQAAQLVRELPPKEKKPPVIIYDAKDGSQAEIVARTVIDAGYKNVQIVTGGFDAWQGAGFETRSGQLAARATYERTLLPGEISMDEFRKIAAQPASVMIVDVRNPDETKAGVLKGAVLIPSETIKERRSELTADKLIVTHCSTGTRAEMAYHTIKEMGIGNVRFVNAKLDIKQDGSYVMTQD